MLYIYVLASLDLGFAMCFVPSVDLCLGGYIRPSKGLFGCDHL